MRTRTIVIAAVVALLVAGGVYLAVRPKAPASPKPATRTQPKPLAIPVPASIRPAVLAGLKAGGVKVGQPKTLVLKYGYDTRHITATAGAMTAMPKGSKRVASITDVNLELVGKTWRVLSIVGNY